MHSPIQKLVEESTNNDGALVTVSCDGRRKTYEACKMSIRMRPDFATSEEEFNADFSRFEARGSTETGREWHVRVDLGGEQ